MTLENRLAALERRMDTSDHERQSMLDILRENSQTIEKVANDTEELRELWSEARGAFRLFTRLVSFGRTFVRFVVLPVALLLAAIYAWVHEGRPPTWLRSVADIVE
jgi:hypothetical protein